MVRYRLKSPAFTLVEVVLALGILIFAGFALISLMAEGFQSSKDSKQQFQAATIAEYICATRRTAPIADFSTTQPYFPLPNLTNAVATGNTNNFGPSGTPIYLTWDGATTNQPNAFFGLLYSITAPTTYVPTVNPAAATVYLYIYWPPQMSASNATNGATSHYEVTTAIAMP